MMCDEPPGVPWPETVDGNRLLALVNLCVEQPIVQWHSGPDFFELPAGEPQPYPTLLAGLLRQLTYHNYQIWHYEDICRGDDQAAVVAAKRHVDHHNQRRNDTIEQIDQAVIEREQAARSPAVPTVSETLGSLLDRISVTRLKIYHLAIRQHVAELGRLQVLLDQLFFLKTHAARLLDALRAGRRRQVVFRQLKQYNDPSTNHHLAEATWKTCKT